MKWLLTFPLAIIISLNMALAKPVTVDFSTEELQQLSGHYSTVFGYLYVYQKKNQLVTHFEGKRLSLIKKSDGKLYPIYKWLGFIPIPIPIPIKNVSLTVRKNVDNHRIALHTEDGSHIVAQQFKNVAIGENWKRFAGHYRTTILSGKSSIKYIELAIINDVILVNINGGLTSYPLLKKAENQVYVPATGNDKDIIITVLFKGSSMELHMDDSILQLNKIPPHET